MNQGLKGLPRNIRINTIRQLDAFADFPTTGDVRTLYIALDTDILYYWSGTAYVGAGAGSVVWGTITGTLSSQTDLQTALDEKMFVECGVDANGTDNYTISAPVALTSYAKGTALLVKPQNTNTGACTVDVDGLGAIDLLINGGVAMSAGEFRANAWYWIVCDITHWHVIDQNVLATTIVNGDLLHAPNGNAVYDQFAKQVSILGNLTQDTIAASTTSYFPVLGGAARDNTTESQTQIPMVFAGVIDKLYIRTYSAQNAGGSLVFTLRVNGVDTALTVTVPAGTASLTSVADTTNAVTVAAGDLVSMKVVNNYAGGVSASTGMFMRLYNVL